MFLFRSSRLGTMVLASCVVACTETGTRPTEDVGYDVSISSGDGQRGSAGTILAQPLVVRVNVHPDPRNTGATAVVQTIFEVESGGGEIKANENSTFRQTVGYGSGPVGNSFPSVLWKLGPQAGTNTVKVTFTGVNVTLPNFLRFTATGTPPTDFRP